MFNRFLNTVLQRSPAKKKQTRKRHFSGQYISVVYRLNKRIYVHRGVARIPAKVQDGKLCSNSLQISIVNYYYKAPHLRCLQRSWIFLWCTFPCIPVLCLQIRIIWVDNVFCVWPLNGRWRWEKMGHCANGFQTITASFQYCPKNQDFH